MKYIFFTGLALIILGTFLYALSLILETYAPKQKSPTKYDVILVCQTLDANKTNKDWGYSDCVKNLNDALGGNVRVL